MKFIIRLDKDHKPKDEFFYPDPGPPPIRQVGATFKKAERHKVKGGEQLEIKESDID
jgi:hypothetical protein